ncbi:hypothetical protein [Ciceribacter selenitireducens]|uniref:hypothetical protein n=1 Tax=Ciceribacter selenitireducens TaxID=448181 RepID=UPI0012EB48EE|nr:hypothetical protein [Ciceribacter selenitireducens]
MTHDVLLEATFCGFLVRRPVTGGGGMACDPLLATTGKKMGTAQFEFKAVSGR